MPRPGRPPQPTKLRLLRGNPGKRKINRREPQPVAEVPSCPDWLSAEAKEVWKDTVALLSQLNILARVDRDALTAYAQVYVRWRATEQWLDQHGLVYPLRDEKGKIRCMQQFPQVSIARNYLQAVRAFQTELGMSPSARSRVHEIPGFLRDPDDEKWFGPH